MVMFTAHTHTLFTALVCQRHSPSPFPSHHKLTTHWTIYFNHRAVWVCMSWSLHSLAWLEVTPLFSFEALIFKVQIMMYIYLGSSSVRHRDVEAQPSCLSPANQSQTSATDALRQNLIPALVTKVCCSQMITISLSANFNCHQHILFQSIGSLVLWCS